MLTKRAPRIARLGQTLPWRPHIWAGVSVESNQYVFRADHLRKVPASIRFISAEPLLGPLDRLNLEEIHWLITGGESGPRHRPCDPDWVRDLRDRCVAQGVAYFHKQWGGRTPKVGGRLLDGRTWDEMPTVNRDDEDWQVAAVDEALAKYRAGEAVLHDHDDVKRRLGAKVQSTAGDSDPLA